MFPNVVEEIMNAIENISLQVSSVMKLECSERERRIEKMIDINHKLLCCLGVGHPALEKIVQLSEKYGFHTKLTGAGGKNSLHVY
jgi:mevalonate kinase